MRQPEFGVRLVNQSEAMSVDVFCERHGLSRSSFYRMLRRNEGPATMKVGKRILIAREAAEDWRARMTAKTVAQQTGDRNEAFKYARQP